jgi:hypothetical protein
MSGTLTSITRRGLLVTAAAATAISVLPGQLAAAVGGASIRPIEFSFTDEQRADLRRRIAETRWPEKQTVEDSSRGVPLATMRWLMLVD